MNIIQQITSDTYQKQNLVLPDGTSMNLTLRFVPMQLSWFIDELVYGDFVLQGYRIFNSPNMLHQFKNLIPFGLACVSNESREPSLQQDFSSGASTLYILTAAETAQYTEFLSGQAIA